MNRRQFDEVVAFAIEKEQEAVDAYTTASSIVKRAHVRAMLLEFAAQEERHKRKLQGIDLETLDGAHIVKIPDLRISDYSDSVEITADMDYQDVLTVAMKREEGAHNLYTILASNTTESALKRVFEMLAQEEAKHKLALEKEYDEHVLSEN
ncbi:MAG: ferritin family protein [Candidatus Eisenbacteria bacterium]